MSFGNRLPYYYILASIIDRKNCLIRLISVISNDKTHISTYFRTKNTLCNFHTEGKQIVIILSQSGVDWIFLKRRGYCAGVCAVFFRHTSVRSTPSCGTA